MKKIVQKSLWLALVAVMAAPLTVKAQDEEKEKDKQKEKAKDVQQIIITRKSDKDSKVVVEIVGDKITVNGKPLDEYKNKDGDISVRLNKLRDLESLTYMRGGQPRGSWNFNGNGNNNFMFFGADENRAMLGVTTEKTEEGTRVQEVTKGSAAEKIGLKEGDIITKIGDVKIADPDDLSEAIKAQKPGDKVKVTYLRNKKEMKAEAELTKWQGINAMGEKMPMENFKLDLGDLNLQSIPRMEELRGMAPFGGQNWSWSGGSPKLGLSVQDTEDGKGVKVVDVDGESNAAKAGIKEDDIITQVDDKAVNSVDEIARMLKEKKDNPSVKIQLLRNGAAQTIEVKMPRKTKTADL